MKIFLLRALNAYSFELSQDFHQLDQNDILSLCYNFMNKKQNQNHLIYYTLVFF
jgi:hypothetical protein